MTEYRAIITFPNGKVPATLDCDSLLMFIDLLEGIKYRNSFADIRCYRKVNNDYEYAGDFKGGRK